MALYRFILVNESVIKLLGRNKFTFLLDKSNGPQKTSLGDSARLARLRWQGVSLITEHITRTLLDNLNGSQVTCSASLVLSSYEVK